MQANPAEGQLVFVHGGEIFSTAHLMGLPDAPKVSFWTRKKKDPTWKIYLLQYAGQKELLWVNCSESQVVPMMEIIERNIRLLSQGAQLPDPPAKEFSGGCGVGDDAKEPK